MVFMHLKKSEKERMIVESALAGMTDGKVKGIPRIKALFEEGIKEAMEDMTYFLHHYEEGLRYAQKKNSTAEELEIARTALEDMREIRARYKTHDEVVSVLDEKIQYLSRRLTK